MARALSSHAHAARAAVGGGTFQSLPAECFKTTQPDEADTLPTEEDASHNDDFVPLSERLAHKADAMDAELERLWTNLMTRQQMLSAKRSYSICPASFAPSTAPTGSSSLVVGPVLQTLSRLFGRAQPSINVDALAELNAQSVSRRIAKAKRLHQLNYYSTLTLVPKRNMWLSVYTMLWNGLVGVQNAVAVVPLHMVRAVARPSQQAAPLRLVVGVASGALASLRFLAYGILLSPVIHIPNGLVNSWWGFVSFYRGHLFFDAESGRYFYCDLRHADVAWATMLEEIKTIKTIGIVEFQRKKMKPDNKFTQQLKNIGFRVSQSKTAQRMKAQAGINDSNAADDPYEVLHVKKSATPAQVKQQYKKLAKVFHPDVVQAQRGGVLQGKDKEEAQRKFESIAEAYQILSNPEKKRAYDQGGKQGLKMQESKFGQFASSSAGEMVQSVFGGRALKETLLGELYKSHWDLRYQHQISVSMHSLECMQSMRVVLLAMKLREVVDVHALRKGSPGPAASSAVPPPSPTTSQKVKSPDPLLTVKKAATTTDVHQGISPSFPPSEWNAFSADYTKRCEAFAKALSEACYGPAIIHDLGMSYSISAKRFLGVEPFYTPKTFVFRTLCRGFTGMAEGFNAHVKGKTHEELAKMVLAEWFNLEYFNVMSDAVLIVRYAAQVLLQDQSVSEDVRKKRAYALWYFGEALMRHGTPFGEGKRDDAELVAYLQQAATSVKSTGPPPTF